MKILLDDISCKNALYPFTATRSVIDIRIGVLTIREKWERIHPGFLLISEMEGEPPPDFINIPGNILPDLKLINEISNSTHYDSTVNDCRIDHPWHIFQLNEQAITSDFELITKGRISAPLPPGVHAIDPGNIFVEEGAIVRDCYLNASNGPIYIGSKTEIMEGSLIRGPVALCEGSIVKMGTRIYGATTIGPYSTVGGEIKNSVIFGYSNKAHDGYLGDSVIGEWCNLGAGTSNSNLKNTAGEVRVWSNPKNAHIPAGNKCGLFMGDYSRAAINTSFNTGTMVGVCCNVFGTDVPPTYISDFSWGTERYKLDGALRDINNWKKLKGFAITGKEIKILTDIHSSQN